MDLVQACNAPEPLPLAGKDYPVRALKFREWAPLQAWLLKSVPSPIARVAQALQQLKDSGQAVDALTEEVMLDHAQREALNWPPRVGSRSWIDAVDSVPGGLAELVLTVLSATVPGYARAQAESLVEALSTAEVYDLVNLSAYGIRPEKKGGAAEPAAPEPTPAPASSPG